MKSPSNRFPIRLSVDDISYLLDRLVIIGWVFTTPLWIAEYYRSAIWIAYVLALLSILDIVLHFKAYAYSASWLLLFVVACAGYLQTDHWSTVLDQTERTARETETHFWLIPANDSSPPNGCLAAGSAVSQISNPLFIFLDDNIVFTAKVHHLGIVRYSDCMLLSATIDPQGLLIDGDIYNSAGNLTVHIDRNEINLTSGEFAYRKRSEDGSALEVYDEQNRRLLYVRYVNLTTIEVLGEFRCHNSPPIIVRNTGIELPDHNTMSGNCANDVCGSQMANCAAFMF
jgi:hypothetical protein